MDMMWLAHLGKDGEEKKEFLMALRGSDLVLERIEEILVGYLDAVETRSLSLDSYKNPSWAYFQADVLGEKRAYTKLLKLIKSARQE